MSQGRPQACQNSECDTELLSGAGGLLQVPGLPWPLSEILTWRASLARIKQKLNKTFSSTVTPERRLTYLEKVDLDLMKWREGLPHEFRPEQQTILDNDGHIDIYTLHLDYFNLLQTIHWALIKQWPDASRRDQAAPRIRASESICLGACLSLVRTLNA
jgi:environmental stress-induced protein Ves